MVGGDRDGRGGEKEEGWGLGGNPNGLEKEEKEVGGPQHWLSPRAVAAAQCRAPGEMALSPPPALRQL